MKVDPRLPKYDPPKEKINGMVGSGNSDVLNNILTLWAEQMLMHHPEMQFQIEGKGTSTPEHELTFGRMDLAGMTRLMRDEAVKRFRDKHGYEPTPLRIIF